MAAFIVATAARAFVCSAFVPCCAALDQAPETTSSTGGGGSGGGTGAGDGGGGGEGGAGGDEGCPANLLAVALNAPPNRLSMPDAVVVADVVAWSKAVSALLMAASVMSAGSSDCSCNFSNAVFDPKELAAAIAARFSEPPTAVAVIPIAASEAAPAAPETISYAVPVMDRLRARVELTPGALPSRPTIAPPTCPIRPPAPPATAPVAPRAPPATPPSQLPAWWMRPGGAGGSGGGDGGGGGVGGAGGDEGGGVYGGGKGDGGGGDGGGDGDGGPGGEGGGGGSGGEVQQWSQHPFQAIVMKEEMHAVWHDREAKS